jgi:hypothetical protein
MFVRTSLYNLAEIAYHLFLLIYFSGLGFLMKCLHCACLVVTAVTKKEYYFVLGLRIQIEDVFCSFISENTKEITIIYHTS